MNEQIPTVWPGWRTVRVIGRGSYGAVYEVEREIGGELERAAVKCISLPQSTGDIEDMLGNGYDRESLASHFDNQLQDITREYKLMAALKGNSNIVSCEDFICDRQANGIGWDVKIRMELLTPMMRMENPPAPEALALGLGRDLCKALILCTNRNIVHRDIKPQNIFVSRDGDYKLGDFGIARTMEKTTGATKTGTYNYMAPEVYNNRPYGHQADVYSLGMVLYWALNERRGPFLPLPPRVPTATEQEQARLRRFDGEALPPPAHGSEGLKRIVLKACAFDPKDRYAHAGELYNDLQLIGTAREAEAGKAAAPAAPKTASGKKKSKAPLLGVLAAAAALAVLAGIFLPRLREGAETGMAPEPADTVEDESLNPTPEAESEDDPEEPEIVLYEKDGVSFVRKGNMLIISGTGNMPKPSSALEQISTLKKEITDVTVEEGISAIPDWAFSEWTALKNVSLPDSVSSLGNEAFSHDAALEEVRLPEGLTELGYDLFLECTNLRSLTIPDGVRKIGSSAFGKTGLEVLRLPDTVTEIGRDACYSCPHLTCVILPESLQTIEPAAFLGCYSLTDVFYAGDEAHWAALSEEAQILPNTIEVCCNARLNPSAGDNPKTAAVSLYHSGTLVCARQGGAFTVCGTGEAGGFSERIPDWKLWRTEIETLTVKKGITGISVGAFSGCSALREAELPINLTSLGGAAFKDCTSLVTLEIPYGVTEIGHGCFGGCTALQRITIPESVTELGDNAFDNCSSLSEVTIPGGITKIGNYVFSCCGIRDITLPQGVTRIGNSAFSGCRNLETITIPQTVENVGDYAFDICRKLKTVKYAGSENQWEAITVGKGNEALTGAGIQYNVT